MKLPSFLTPKAQMFHQLWKREMRENARLRRELREWQNLTLKQAKLPKLFELPPKHVEPVKQPPVGPLGKQAWLASETRPNAIPTAEEIFSSNGN